MWFFNAFLLNFSKNAIVENCSVKIGKINFSNILQKANIEEYSNIRLLLFDAKGM